MQGSRLGLPAHCTFKSLVFIPTADVLVVMLYLHGAKVPVSRLFWRKRNSVRYHELGRPEKDVSFEFPVVASGSRRLYFNVLRITKIAMIPVEQKKPVQGGREARGQVWGSEWLGIWQVNLGVRKTVSRVLGPSELNAMLGGQEAWVTQLLSVWNRGKGLYCVIGSQKDDLNALGARPVHATKSRDRVQYAVYNFDLERRILRVAAHMHGAFY